MFYERLEALCTERGMSVPDACVRSGLHRSANYSWKRGHGPSKRSAGKLAKTLGTTAEYLLRGVSDRPEQVRADRFVRDILKEVEFLDDYDRVRVLRYAHELAKGRFREVR